MPVWMLMALAIKPRPPDAPSMCPIIDFVELIASLPETANASKGVQVGFSITALRIAQLATLYYFAYFPVILPMLGLRE